MTIQQEAACSVGQSCHVAPETGQKGEEPGGGTNPKQLLGPKAGGGARQAELWVERLGHRGPQTF